MNQSSTTRRNFLSLAAVSLALPTTLAAELSQGNSVEIPPPAKDIEVLDQYEDHYMFDAQGKRYWFEAKVGPEPQWRLDEINEADNVFRIQLLNPWIGQRGLRSWMYLQVDGAIEFSPWLLTMREYQDGYTVLRSLQYRDKPARWNSIFPLEKVRHVYVQEELDELPLRNPVWKGVSGDDVYNHTLALTGYTNMEYFDAMTKQDLIAARLHWVDSGRLVG